MDAIMEHGGITALLVLLNNGHLEAWSSATHTLHMLCSSMPAAAVMITQSGMPMTTACSFFPSFFLEFWAGRIFITQVLQ